MFADSPVRPAVEARLQAAKRLRRTGLLADKRSRVLRAARATYLELECESPAHSQSPCNVPRLQRELSTLHDMTFSSVVAASAAGRSAVCFCLSAGPVAHYGPALVRPFLSPVR